MSEEKRCSICGEVKPLSEFAQHGRAKDGHEHQCLACKRKAKETRNERRSLLVISAREDEHVDCLIRDFTPREMLAALKRLGYVWSDMTLTQKITYESI